MSARSVGSCVARAGFVESKRRPIGMLFWSTFGLGQLEVADAAPIALPAGAAVLIAPNISYRLSAADTWRYRWLTCDGTGTTALMRGFGCTTCLACPPRPCPDAAFATLTGLLRDDDHAARLEAAALTFRLLLQAVSLPPPPADPLVARALALIARGIADPDLSVASLAAALAVSPEHLSRQLRQRCGAPPRDLILRARLDRARELLAATGRPVAEIGRACGFPDPNHFARRFRAGTGCAPSVYAARHSDPGTTRPGDPDAKIDPR